MRASIFLYHCIICFSFSAFSAYGMIPFSFSPYGAIKYRPLKESWQLKHKDFSSLKLAIAAMPTARNAALEKEIPTAESMAVLVRNNKHLLSDEQRCHFAAYALAHCAINDREQKNHFIQKCLYVAERCLENRRFNIINQKLPPTAFFALINNQHCSEKTIKRLFSVTHALGIYNNKNGFNSSIFIDDFYTRLLIKKELFPWKLIHLFLENNVIYGQCSLNKLHDSYKDDTPVWQILYQQRENLVYNNPTTEYLHRYLTKMYRIFFIHSETPFQKKTLFTPYTPPPMEYCMTLKEVLHCTAMASTNNKPASENSDYYQTLTAKAASYNHNHHCAWRSLKKFNDLTIVTTAP